MFFRAQSVKLSAMFFLPPRLLASACLLLMLSGCAAAKPENAPPMRVVPAQPTQIATLADKSIDELSGLCASRRYPGLLWCHNDSGDSARIFALNQSGQTVATVDFNGLEARDWEDMTFAGTWIYVAEIGDNLAINENIRVYRTHEPQFDPDKTGQTVTLQPNQWEEMTLHYPDGARDAETLAATPDGRLLIVSKSKSGSNFYVLSTPFENGKDAVLAKIQSKVQFGGVGWLTKLVTGGEFSPDGKQLALTTYAQLVQIPLSRPFDFSSLQLDARQTRDLPPLKQCESLCYSVDGRSFYVSSEGKGAPVWELPLSGDSKQETRETRETGE